jgi:hypothetical protein
VIAVAMVTDRPFAPRAPATRAGARLQALYSASKRRFSRKPKKTREKGQKVHLATKKCFWLIYFLLFETLILDTKY